MKNRWLFLVAAVVGAAATPAIAKAWTRAYGFGGNTTIANAGDITFVDDTTMGVNNMTHVRVYAYNSNSSNYSTVYAQARCCYMAVGTGQYSCAAVSGLSHATQAESLDMTGLCVNSYDAGCIDYCKNNSNGPYLQVLVSSNNTTDAAQIKLIVVATDGT